MIYHEIKKKETIIKSGFWTILLLWISKKKFEWWCLQVSNHCIVLVMFRRQNIIAACPLAFCASFLHLNLDRRRFLITTFNRTDNVTTRAFTLGAAGFYLYQGCYLIAIQSSGYLKWTIAIVVMCACTLSEESVFPTFPSKITSSYGFLK